MSLTAVVYKNEINFSEHPLRRFFSVDPKTGQMYSIDGSVNDYAMGDIQAVSKYLGNISTVIHLEKVVGEVLDPSSIIRSKILYSGSHAGDILPKEDSPQLLEELNVLMSRFRVQDELVSAFIDSLIELAFASQRENNPIVF
jgi:hypothetical protein